MRGWLYVLELAPTGYVKVGRTDKLGARLGTHISSAHFGGGEVVRTFSVACDDAAQVERTLLAVLRAHRGAVLVHGKETFCGVPFVTVTRLADEVAERGGSPVLRALRSPGSTQGFLEACRAALDATDAKRMSLAQIGTRLADAHPDLYTGVTPAGVGKALRAAGVQIGAVWCPSSGKVAKGVKREWLAAAA